MAKKPGTIDHDRLDQLVAEARKARDQRERGYRERALAMYPWICGRCGRDFTQRNLRELTVHHRNHNHDDNPADGSNWELLCLYCHDNEHQRQLEAGNLAGAGLDARDNAKLDQVSSHRPFGDLAALLGGSKE